MSVWDEQYKNINNLQEQLEKIVALQNQMFSQLDPEQYELVKEYHADANDMVRKFKKGDTRGLDKYMDKYIKK
jgi:hypothetical protein